MRTKTLLTSLILGLSLAFPLPAFSAGVLRIDDSIAGIGLQASLSGFSAQQSVDIVVVPPSGKYLVFPTTLDALGNAQVHVPGTSTEQAGAYTAFIGRNGERLSPDVAFQILPDTIEANTSTLVLGKESILTNGKDVAPVTVTLRDRYSNILPGRPVELFASDRTATISASTRETDAKGQITFSLTTQQAGVITVRALDLLSNTIVAATGEIHAGSYAANANSLYGSVLTSPFNAQVAMEITTASGAVSVQDLATSPLAATTSGEHAFDVLQSFEITVDPQKINVNDLTSITVRAVDKKGQTVEDYVGTVDIYSPTDPSAILPLGGFGDAPGRGKIQFAAKNLGNKFLPFSVSFKRAGTHILRVEDATDPLRIITGEVLVTVLGSTGAGHPLEILKPAQNGTINDTNVTLEGIGQPYTNIEVTGGSAKATGATDSEGKFSIKVTLDSAYNEYTLSIRDNVGNEATHHLVRDTDPPAIISATFSPEKPEEATSVLLVVQSEPGLPDMKFRLDEMELTVAEDPVKPGTYQLLFTAPKPGTHQGTLITRDTAGNRQEKILTLVSTAKALPRVDRVKVEARAGAAYLKWDPVRSEPVDFYRVYVGERPGDFAYSLDTPDASKAEATVTGLQAGLSYTFAITAVKSDRESEKSESVTTRPLGIVLKVTPQTEALLLAWSLPSPLSLDSFRVEYGTEPDALSEVRTVLGGDMATDEERSIVLSDLLPNVQYFIRITPYQTTKDPITDLIVRTEGTPLSDGTFHASPADPVPFDPEAGQTVTPPPPSEWPTGIPEFAWWTLGGIAIVAVLALVRRRRGVRMTEHFLQSMEARYHS